MKESLSGTLSRKSGGGHDEYIIFTFQKEMALVQEKMQGGSFKKIAFGNFISSIEEKAP